jgi:hypothetical protein
LTTAHAQIVGIKADFGQVRKTALDWKAGLNAGEGKGKKMNSRFVGSHSLAQGEFHDQGDAKWIVIRGLAALRAYLVVSGTIN